MVELRLSARGLRRVFPGGAGVHGVDLDVGAGQVHALVGLNGAGKTTLMRLVLGMLQPDAGTVRIGGRDVSRADAMTWRRVGHLIDQALIYPELDVTTNLALAALLHGVNAEALPATIERALVDLDVGRYSDVRARVLSSGNRQRVGLAGVLAHDPDLIVVDEPTNALDPAAVIRLRDLLRERADRGAGVLVSSHHLDEVARIADRISVMNNGRLIGTLNPGGVDLERAFFTLIHADDVKPST